MAIPKQKDIEIPLLNYIFEAGGSIKAGESYQHLAKHFNLTNEDRSKKRDDGRDLWENLVQWARNELVKKDELDGSEHGIWKITESGLQRIGKLSQNDGSESFYNELIKFLNQTTIEDLKTSYYKKNYSDLKVVVSFGQGNSARIPWIAFTKDDNRVMDGIYPVYLYFKSKSLLVLAYGISETNEPREKWDLNNPITIIDYFSKNDIGEPERYGKSYVYKTYPININKLDELDKDKMDKDLNYLINFYKNTTQPPTPIMLDYTRFFKDALSANFSIEKNLCTRFISSLLTKPFVILTGLSGSGKTKLAQIFAMWICEDESQYCIVPVGADWTNREPLLGFPNALKEDEYVHPDNNVLNLIIESNNNPDKPYFLILDEMNLSHVERYFAEFLSTMESKSKIQLHPGEEPRSGVPSEISFPENLFIIGTVNIDETTYMFSPKVLDRANVIEFRVNSEEMQKYLQNLSTLDLESIRGLGKNMAVSFVDTAKDTNIKPKNIDDLKAPLMNFFNELEKTGAEFGYRSAYEILRFAGIVNNIESSWTTDQIIDSAVLQKLLPKVHGSRKKLEPVLNALGTMCLNGNQTFSDFLKINPPDLSSSKYPDSLLKIRRMHENLISNGFTSFAEA